MRAKLNPGEKKILTVRKHWVTMAGPFLALCAILAFAGALFYYGYGREALVAAAFSSPFVLYLVYSFIEKRYNIWVVTNLRVIDECGVFGYSAKESPLDKIHNISCRQSLFGRLLDYGSVEIQTAAEMGATSYYFVSSPKKLKDAVMEAQASRSFPGAATEERPGIDTKPCPYCAETIKAKAIVCRFCGKDLE